MNYELELVHLPGGVLAHSADPDEQVQVIISDWAIDGAGERFHQYLGVLSNFFLGPFFELGQSVSSIDHCLVVTTPPNRARVYINEVACIAAGMASRNITAGETVKAADFAGITELLFPNIDIDSEQGIIYFFSVGWRRAIFFDLSPHQLNGRVFDLHRRLGQLYENLVFPELYSLDSETWNWLFTHGWFPFISLRHRAQKQLYSLLARIKEGKSTHVVEQELIDLFEEQTLLELLEKFKKSNLLRPHITIIEAGIRQYMAGDMVSAINNIWPRIEGILRYAYQGPYNRPSQKVLVENIESALKTSHIVPTVYFPEQFRKYLLEYYFQDFDIKTHSLAVSRHSIGHGVADPVTYDKKRALIGILIVDQLLYYLQIRPQI